MELLTSRDGKAVWFHQVERSFSFDWRFAGRRYVAIVFANDESVTDAERRAITEALFASGCRYGVFSGHACRAWEESLDSVCIQSDPNYDPPDEAFTMTTSHPGESIRDVIFFGLMNTSFGAHDFDFFLVLFIGSRLGLREEIETAIRSVYPGS